MTYRLILILCFLFIFIGSSVSQTIHSNDPYDVAFITEDFDRFWMAVEKYDAGDTLAFNWYLDNASKGVEPFRPYLSADMFKQAIAVRRSDYMDRKDILENLPRYVKRIRATYFAMKYWYPDAQFPPVYFAMGVFSSGGTASDQGLLIGVELLDNLDALPGLIAHELIHFQQSINADNDLLSQALVEGSADFIGELISGEHINMEAFKYGEAHESDLKIEFLEKLDDVDYTDWLYGTSGKDERPNDLGYWIGYKITEAYFDKPKNKKEAIRNVLTMTDVRMFLSESGYFK